MLYNIFLAEELIYRKIGTTPQVILRLKMKFYYVVAKLPGHKTLTIKINM